MPGMNRRDSVRRHYNKVADSWVYILGENFHFGYFRTKDEDLDQATRNLIDLMANLGHVSEKTPLLDVGCGIGEPALCLYETYHCDITGLTLSEKEAEIANHRARMKGYQDAVRFEVADILDSESLPFGFDVVWAMESSNLITDKKALFSRCYELLQDGGELLLCDIMPQRNFPLDERYRYWRELSVLEQTFGEARTESLTYYRMGLEDAGFRNVQAVDISTNVYPSMECWRRNISKNYGKIKEHGSRQLAGDFLASCDILEHFYHIGLFGYGLVRGCKMHV